MQRSHVSTRYSHINISGILSANGIQRLILPRSLATGRIVLVELQASLPADIKRFIGTLIISELLHAVLTRPAANRPHFCIFVDEFQHFATDDFGTLITDARKFGVATTIAHQERFGQFNENPRALGSTSAAANKVLFQLTVNDATELAPEFAPMPEATDLHREAILTPSTRPVEDIWENGHPEEWIQQIRGRFFWIVDLLKRSQREEYFVFDPKFGLSVRSMKDEHYLQWGSGLIDWVMYRASSEMLRDSVSLLNAYFYDWMNGTYQKGASLSGRETDVFFKLITNLGGIYGIRPSMHAVITEEGRQVWYRRFMEREEHIIREAKEERRRLEARGPGWLLWRENSFVE